MYCYGSSGGTRCPGFIAWIHRWDRIINAPLPCSSKSCYRWLKIRQVMIDDTINELMPLDYILHQLHGFFAQLQLSVMLKMSFTNSIKNSIFSIWTSISLFRVEWSSAWLYHFSASTCIAFIFLSVANQLLEKKSFEKWP